MLDAQSGSAVERAVAMPAHAPLHERPLFLPVPAACRHFGDIKKTAFYSMVERHQIRLVHIGGRSLVPWSEIERVAAELMAATERRDCIKSRTQAMAARSVAVRRSRRG